MSGKDPWCCASDKLRISVDGFDQGCLTTYRSVRYTVAHLPREQALEVIDQLVANLEVRVEARRQTVIWRETLDYLAARAAVSGEAQKK